MNTLKISLFGISTKIFRKPFVKGESRYRKINFFTTSALLNYIFELKEEKVGRIVRYEICFDRG
jgi:hypothetical protein